MLPPAVLAIFSPIFSKAASQLHSTKSFPFLGGAEAEAEAGAGAERER
jgi:hypothetical protein